jgi:hypothetical protein
MLHHAVLYSLFPGLLPSIIPSMLAIKSRSRRIRIIIGPAINRSFLIDFSSVSSRGTYRQRPNISPATDVFFDCGTNYPGYTSYSFIPGSFMKRR